MLVPGPRFLLWLLLPAPTPLMCPVGVKGPEKGASVCGGDAGIQHDRGCQFLKILGKVMALQESQVRTRHLLGVSMKNLHLQAGFFFNIGFL